MADDVATEPDGRSILGRAAQWLAGPLVWSAHFLVVYFAVEAGCRSAAMGTLVLGLTALTWTILVTTLLAVAVLVYAGLRAYRAWQATRDSVRRKADRRPLDRLANDDRQLMLVGGWMLSAVFGVFVLVSAFLPLVLRTCPWS